MVINRLNDPAAGSPAMNITLEADSLSGTAFAPAGDFPVGTHYLVKAFVQDVRTTPTGVFAAYMGLNYSSNVSVDGAKTKSLLLMAVSHGRLVHANVQRPNNRSDHVPG